jgi:flagellar hook-associated protein 3 FlgL
MGVSVPGSDVFMNIRNGNGTFVTGTGGNLAQPPVLPATANNLGNATADAGSVLDPGKWNAAGNPKDLMVQFSVTTNASGLKSTTYQIYDTSGATPVALLATPLNYTAGQSISLQKTTTVPAPATDYGASIVVQGQPADGDTLTVSPSTNQSLFQTMQNLIGVLRTPVGTTTYTSTQYTNDLAGQLTNIDQAINGVGQVQATVGTRMRELDSLGTASSDLALQYSTTLSNLQDLDYNKALTDYSKQQVSLEAAQKAFVQISDLSLFKYL